MKVGIHPSYKRSVVTCVCGNTFETRSTVGDLKVEICSNCHPFFTGKQKLVDSAGRVEKFMRKYRQKDKNVAAKQDQTSSDESKSNSGNAKDLEGKPTIVGAVHENPAACGIRYFYRVFDTVCSSAYLKTTSLAISTRLYTFALSTLFGVAH